MSNRLKPLECLEISAARGRQKYEIRSPKDRSRVGKCTRPGRRMYEAVGQRTNHLNGSASDATLAM